MSQDSFTLKTV